MTDRLRTRSPATRAWVAACLVYLVPVAFAQQAADPREPTAEVAAVLTEAGDPRVVLRVFAPNAWFLDGRHSAVWLTLRGEDPRGAPLRIAPGRTVQCQGKVAAGIRIAEDGLGVFVEPTARCRGAAAWEVSLPLVEAPERTVTAWPIDMVFVDRGAFQAGDDQPLAVRFGAVHGVDDSGAVGGPLWIDDESELRVAKEIGAVWYETNEYRGDQKGPIPAAWPKGTDAFYVMRRELTQGQYAAWLNALPAEAVATRAPTGLEGEEIETCTIARDADGRWIAGAPTRPCNFVSWDDTAAWLDWHGLRPMTELEYEKAARGPTRPVSGDYPWGTATTDDVQRVVTDERDLALATLERERELDALTREVYGASYYGAFDLSGSLWERVVSLGHPRGRAFEGTHGDGVLAARGFATNPDWPRGDAEGKSAPGIGYRGGAEYFKQPTADDPTNPFSPVAVRTYGAWDGAYRYKTYSARGVRTAPPPADLTPEELTWFPRRFLQFLQTQKAARTMTEGMPEGEQRQRATELLAKIDAEGVELIRAVVERAGWPPQEVVGERALAGMMEVLLRDGVDAELLGQCLQGVRAAYERSEVSPADLAALTDRLRVAQQRPQVYGTLLLTARDSAGEPILDADRPVVLAPIVEDPTRLDERRKALGLAPWIEGMREQSFDAPRAWDGRWPVDHRARPDAR